MAFECRLLAPSDFAPSAMAWGPGFSSGRLVACFGDAMDGLTGIATPDDESDLEASGVLVRVEEEEVDFSAPGVVAWPSGAAREAVVSAGA